MDLRDYQLRAAGSFRVAVQKGHRSILLVLATGLGKTEIFTYIADRWVRGRVLVVAPLVELVGQAAKKIYQRTGEMPGIEQADLRSNEHELMRSRFVVGSKQSLCGRSQRYRALRDISLVVIDEAHLSLTADYKEMIEWFVGQGATVLGVTATPKRHDKRALGTLYECCPFNFGMAEAIKLGWLVPPRAECLQLKTLDLQAVKTSKTTGDFNEAQLQEAMEDQRVVFEVAAAVARTCGSLKTVVFCTGVNEAQAVAERLEDNYGLKAAWVCGDERRCPKQRRAEILGSFTGDRDGIQIVVNVGCLTTGWDFPGLEHLVIARLTRSRALYEQMLGRGTRPVGGVVDFPGSTPESRRAAIAASAKPHFKVTDLRDNSLEHKLVSIVDVLGGTLGVLERQKAVEALGRGAAVDVDQAVLDAREQARLEEEARQRRLRATIGAQADYVVHEVDPLEGPAAAGGVAGRSRGRGPVMPFGKHKGRRIAELETRSLRWYVENLDWRPSSLWVKQTMEAVLAERRGR